ncbi:MAG: hypothetical protein P8079_04930 [Gammaproteobacteria bacterium]
MAHLSEFVSHHWTLVLALVVVVALLVMDTYTPGGGALDEP